MPAPFPRVNLCPLPPIRRHGLAEARGSRIFGCLMPACRQRRRRNKKEDSPSSFFGLANDLILKTSMLRPPKLRHLVILIPKRMIGPCAGIDGSSRIAVVFASQVCAL